MLTVPTDQKKLLDFAKETIEACRISVSSRSAQCRQLHTIAETGRYDGSKALINMLDKHLDRTAAHIYSPVELKFSIDFENAYPKNQLERAAVVAKRLTRSWERTNTDTVFGRGVFESLKYGATLLKQWPQVEGVEQTPTYYKKLVMPWQFGVYNEAENDIHRQPALCETALMTLPEIWRRIYHLPNAKDLYKRITTHARKGVSAGEPDSYFHQVLSSSTLSATSGVQQVRPGGMVGMTNDANYAIMGPLIGAEVVNVHELWVQDDEDYTTIIMVEPDIIICPLFKKANLLGVDKQQPYRLIQPNEVTNWFWGRSELVDLIEPQMLLARWCDDAMRLFGLQVDKLLGFIGESGMTDELYGQFRQAGWTNLQSGSDIKDLTPKIFPEMLPMIRFVIETVNTLSGFPEIMQGKGEPGVRAGVHANTLLKTASPTLRDRALLVERQLAGAADLSLAIMEAKDPTTLWTNGETLKTIDETSFKLTDLPQDWRVSVDSHSSSPIFSDENAQLIFAGQKAGFVGGNYMIDNLPFPNREQLKAEFHADQQKKAAQMEKMLEQYPELGEALAKKQLVGGGKR